MPPVDVVSKQTMHVLRRCPTYLLNIAKRSLPELILSGVGLASNDAVG
jgi:hypothetical protein